MGQGPSYPWDALRRNRWVALFRHRQDFRRTASRSRHALEDCAFAVIFGALVYYGYGKAEVSVTTTPAPTAPAQSSR
jgi:hypothetical protein